MNTPKMHLREEELHRKRATQPQLQETIHMTGKDKKGSGAIRFRTCEGRNVHTAGPLALGREQADSQSEQPRPGVPPKETSPLPAGNPLRQPEGWRSLGCTPEERPSWLANRQGREPRTGGCCLRHFPARRGEHPSPAHCTAWCRHGSS